MRRKRNPGVENLGVILGGIVLSGAIVAGLLVWGSSRAKAPSSALPSGDLLRPERVGLFPDLKPGDLVLVDAAAANIPVAANLPTIVCRVDFILSDPTLVSVRSMVSDFKGTIARAAIVRVLPPLAPGVFA
jgi:hypothetical protein